MLTEKATKISVKIFSNRFSIFLIPLCLLETQYLLMTLRTAELLL